MKKSQILLMNNKTIYKFQLQTLVQGLKKKILTNYLNFLDFQRKQKIKIKKELVLVQSSVKKFRDSLVETLHLRVSLEKVLLLHFDFHCKILTRFKLSNKIRNGNIKHNTLAFSTMNFLKRLMYSVLCFRTLFSCLI